MQDGVMIDVHVQLTQKHTLQEANAAVYSMVCFVCLINYYFLVYKCPLQVHRAEYVILQLLVIKDKK